MHYMVMLILYHRQHIKMAFSLYQITPLGLNFTRASDYDIYVIQVLVCHKAVCN